MRAVLDSGTIRLMLPLLALLSTAHAADLPDLLVVGVHDPALIGDAGNVAASRLTEVLDDSGKVDALGPTEVSKRIRGREAIVLESFGLGQGRERLKEARLLYDRAQVEEARPVVEEAVGLLRKGLSVSTSTRELHESLVLLGMVRIALGEEKGAVGAFRKAATLDVSRELDAVNYPPRVIELYNDARAELAKKEPGTLAIQTSVGASVFVDGRAVGAAPLNEVAVVPGEHFVLVRAVGGAAAFQAVTVAPGEALVLDLALQTQGLGTPEEEAAGRSRQIRDLYRSIGEYDDRGAVLIAGRLADGSVGLQIYSPISGNFSRVLSGDAGDDPVGALCDLAPTVAGYLAENGDVRADRVGAQVLGLDVGSNSVLAGLLFDPPSESSGDPTVAPQVVQKGVPWWVWAGTGAVVVGAGATVAAVVLSQPGEEEPGPDEVDPNQGSILFGPMP